MAFRRIISLLAALLLLLTGTAFAEANEEPIIYDVTDYFDTISDLDLSPYKGKIITLFFYTCSDPEAQATLPMWKLIHDDFDPDELAIVLVHAWDGEGQEESDAAIAQYHLEDLIIYEDEDCSLCRQLNLSEYPNILILDQEGTPASGYGGQLSYPTMAQVLVNLGVTQLQDSYSVPAK